MNRGPLIDLVSRRRSIHQLPSDRDAFQFLLTKPKDPVTFGYSEIVQPTEKTNEILINAKKGYYRTDLNNCVIRSWMFAPGSSPPMTKPSFDPLPRNVRLHAGELFFHGHRVVKEAFINFLNLHIKTFAMIVPIFLKEPTNSLTVKGLLVIGGQTYCGVDIEDFETMAVFKDDLMENPGIMKFMINATKELEIFWTQLGISPLHVLCLSSATTKILDEFGIEHGEPDLELQTETLWMLPFYQYFEVHMLPVTTSGAEGLMNPAYGSVAKSMVELTAMVLLGATFLNDQDNWKIHFQYNRLASITHLRNVYVTDALGLNFWPAMNQAIDMRLNLPTFALAFLFVNFATLSSSQRRDVGFVQAFQRYTAVSDIIGSAALHIGDMEAQVNRNDEAFITSANFNFLCANVMLGRINIAETTEMGTVGEMLRRIRHYCPALLPQ